MVLGFPIFWLRFQVLTAPPESFVFTSMVACFGLNDGYQLARFPVERIIEHARRLDVFWLNRIGALVQGTATVLQFDGMAGKRAAAQPKRLQISRQGVLFGDLFVNIVWNSPMFGVDRPYFVCFAIDAVGTCIFAETLSDAAIVLAWITARAI
jgi:hypothetical protein